MKRKILGAVAALITAAAAAITASAEYYIDTERDGNAVKVEVIATGATLPAIEFTVEIPDDTEVDEIDTISGAFFNEDNGIFAWAGTEAPEDGTVMFSAVFTVEDDYEGELAVIPAEGYEDEMPDTLTAEIVGEDGEIEDEETVEDTDDTSDTDSDVSADTDKDSDKNPETGITVSVAAVAAIAGAAIIAARKKSK